MLLKITHQTDLTYSDMISESVMELRVTPRQEQDQHRLSFDLAIGPPTSVTGYFDWLGNAVHALRLSEVRRADCGFRCAAKCRRAAGAPRRRVTGRAGAAHVASDRRKIY